MKYVRVNLPDVIGAGIEGHGDQLEAALARAAAANDVWRDGPPPGATAKGAADMLIVELQFAIEHAHKLELLCTMLDKVSAE
jgi:hypothetical protein